MKITKRSKKLQLSQLILCVTLTLFASLEFQNAFAKQPNNSVILPMPNGLKMEFVPVCVNPGDGFFNWKKIKLGDPLGGFKEYPTITALGGSFPVKRNGKQMWCYYMGKTEVTRQQYEALVTNKKTSPTIHKKNYPITNISWFDAIEFTNHFNQWLFKNNKQTLPKFDKSYGFVRLPTETEWEFAARGGAEVDANFFDKKIPYPYKQLQKYEWFGGPTSSHFKLQPAGVLKPNPLGLYDMLGNADEITMSLFQIEYYQGRIGGFVIKGNNYATAKNKLRSAFRTEQPFYRSGKKGVFQPHKKKTLGFRLVISSLVFPSRNIQQKMSNEWEDYHKNLGSKTPAALSTAPTSIKSSAKGKDAFVYINRIREKLRQGDISVSEIENNLELLNDALQDIAKIRLNAEEDASYLWVKIASEQARFIKNENQKLPTLNLLIKIAKSQKNQKKVETYETRKKEHLINISSALSTYSDSIRQLSTKLPNAINNGFKRYLEFLMEHKDGRQVKVLGKVKKHFDEFQKNKRVNLDKWKADILSLK